MKNFNKAISLTLSAVMLTSPVLTANASSANQKEEVIYIMTDAGGDVDGVYAVNIWNRGEVTDYGDYSSVKLLNTSESIKTEGDKITFKSDKDKVYCEGVLKNTEIPWNISVQYFIDGEELTAEEVAGKSGRLEIKFKVTENKNCKPDFFESYALQANFTLDTKICRNISAEGATSANVGSKKQLSYTIFAGKGIDTTISADVTDFEMDSISINGIKLNMDIDINTSELTEKVTDLNDGIEKIDDGANQVSDGTSELKDGSKKLRDGSSKLSGGAETLDEGIKNLSAGASQIQSGLDTLNSQSSNLTGGSEQVKNALQEINSALTSVNSDTERVKQLVSASGQIKTAISSLKAGADELSQNLGYAQYKAVMLQNGLDMDYLKSANEQTIETLTQQIEQLTATLNQIQNIPGYEEQSAQLETQAEQLSGIVKLLTANNGAIGGTEQYLNTLSEALQQIDGGLAQLDESYTEFDSAVSSLADSLESMVTNVSALSSAINMLTDEYASLDSGINAYTSGVSDICEGYSSLVSGVSKLADGSRNLLEGADSLDKGISDMYNGVTELCDGAGELSGGTGELKDKTSGMDKEIENKIDDVIESVKGKDNGIISFVSDKNKNVKSVQFVIKTDAVEIPEAPEEFELTEEKLSFGQKLKNLFRH